MPVGSSNSAHNDAESTNQKAGPMGRLFGFSRFINSMFRLSDPPIVPIKSRLRDYSAYAIFSATDERGSNTDQVGRVLETRDSVSFHNILRIFMVSILAGHFWLKRSVIVDKMIAVYLSRFSTSLSSARRFFNAWTACLA